MTSDLSISPRNAGSVCLKTYCPRCLAYLLRLKFHPPFSRFGAAIFHDMESCEKAAVTAHLEKHGGLPKEFAPFCDCVERADYPKSWRTFRCTMDNGVTLYGMPDEIFVRKNGTLCVVDHKTAHHKGEGDPFFPQYRIQVIGYSAIAERLGLGDVTKCGLLYWEAGHKLVEQNPLKYYVGGVLSVPFTPKGHEIKIDLNLLDPVLDEVLDVWNAQDLPEGREGCQECKKLDLLFAIDRDLELQDRLRLRAYADVTSIRQGIKQRQDARTRRLNALLEEFTDKNGEIFSQDSMVANWEYAPPDRYDV